MKQPVRYYINYRFIKNDRKMDVTKNYVDNNDITGIVAYIRKSEVETTTGWEVLSDAAKICHQRGDRQPMLNAMFPLEAEIQGARFLKSLGITEKVPHYYAGQWH